MTSEWTTSTLADAGVALLDCEHRTPPAAEAGYAYVAIPQMKTGRLDLSDVRRITADDFREWTRKALPQADDVILSRRCNPGTTAAVPPGFEFALGQNLVLLRADGTGVFPPFLRCLPQGPEWWSQVAKHLNVGAVFDSLRCADVPKFELTIPPLSEQRRTAHILGTLDDKIELNRQMNETLEAMAQALFKSWFIDFDPVIDNALAAGNPIPDAFADRAAKRTEIRDQFPPLSDHILALFSDRFQDSELGPIPEGWEAASVYDLINLIGGGTPKTKVAEYWSGTIPWFSVVDAPRDADVFVIDTQKHVTEAGVANSSTSILPERTTIISARGTVGKCALLGRPMTTNQSCYGIRPSGERGTS